MQVMGKVRVGYRVPLTVVAVQGHRTPPAPAALDILGHMATRVVLVVVALRQVVANTVPAVRELEAVVVAL
jgi:hypothetical protein|tara:strand:+ start:275 stop:487 length:213 start_codon:yes stop_codon:yes gene_type:complete